MVPKTAIMSANVKASVIIRLFTFFGSFASCAMGVTFSTLTFFFAFLLSFGLGGNFIHLKKKKEEKRKTRATSQSVGILKKKK